MLGSTHDADDAVQDALLRAWRGLTGLRAAGALRSWLYTVATRVCLDAAERRRKRALPVDLGPASDAAVLRDEPAGEIAWLGPYPSARLVDVPAGPSARYEQRVAVELAFVAALQHLPGNQRAALLLVEVLGFTPAEIAAMLDTSVASVSSALQRARRIMASKVEPASQQSTLRSIGDARVRELVDGFSDALERGDAATLVALLSQDVTWSMPPLPHWYAGLAAVTDFAVCVPLTGCGLWRHLPTSANGQPAVASYRCVDDSGVFTAWSINVFGVRDAQIADITSFIGPEHFAAFGLPLSDPVATPDTCDGTTWRPTNPTSPPRPSDP
jgi:RNA polymerase sigma-70 factor (ECF subfamily)